MWVLDANGRLCIVSTTIGSEDYRAFSNDAMAHSAAGQMKGFSRDYIRTPNRHS